MANSSELDMAMVAGETSGDLLASLLIQGMRLRWPALRLSGIGGPRMQALGLDSWWPMQKLSVRGYVEVLRHYREIVGIRQQLQARLLEKRPDIFIGVDAPDFNLDLARELRHKGLKTVQYVCPSVWAWRAERLKKIRQSVDHVLCLFPFEPQLLAQHGIDASFVGHPLANLIPEQADTLAARKALNLATDQQVLAVLPGSRKDEVVSMLPRFLAAIQILQRQHPELLAVMPTAPGMEEICHSIINKHAGLRNLMVVSGQSHLVMSAANVALVASGTATLEAALFKCPMVIAYAMPWLSWQIIRRKRLQPWVGLPNILCQDFVVPELLQAEATPQRLAESVNDWLRHPEKVEQLKKTFAHLHQSLRADTATVASDAIAKILRS